ncbi:MAG: hypothetical protein QOJ99_840 [Bryobacterales bacterium]|nr:hypothetical protein [Bryobacterales bacterium]
MFRSLQTIGQLEPRATANVGPLMTREEAMARLRLKASHFSKVVNGKVKNLPPIPTIMIGRRMFFRLEALDQWIIDVEARRCKGAR